MISQGIRLDELLKVPESPFPGLRPFNFEESHLFFGRDGQVGKMITRLAATHFLAVVGTSGSGKSSLVRAGLLPALCGGLMSGAGSKWRIALMRPGNHPLGNLARALDQSDVLGSQDRESLDLQIAVTQATLSRGSRGLIEAALQAAMPPEENLIVVVDQFEELFRFSREARRANNPSFDDDAAAFVKLLLEAVKPAESGRREANIYVVLTMRSDFLGDCAAFWNLPEAINESQYLIPRLTRNQLREVITGPITLAGGKIALQLVNHLLNEIGDNQDQLPILQHALMRTWDEWKRKSHTHDIPPDSSDMIDLCCYQAIGGMTDALSKHADECYRELPDDRHRLVAEKLFKCLTEKGEDNREIRRQCTIGEIRAIAEANEDEVKTIVEVFRLPGRSFLMPPVGTALQSDTLIDISHESLIRVWQRLQQWVNDEAESAATYRRLLQTARLHQEQLSELWRGVDLEVALAWREKNHPSQDWANRYDRDFELAQSFLLDSERQCNLEKAESERRQKEEAERARRELAQAKALAEAQTLAAESEKQKALEQARYARRLRYLTYAMIGVAIMALGFAVVAYLNKTRVEEGKRQVEASEKRYRRFSYVANMTLADMALASRDMTNVSDNLRTFLPAAPISGAGDEDVRNFFWYYLWHHTDKEVATLTWGKGPVLLVAYSPDGRTMATAAEDEVLLWDEGNPGHRMLARLSGHTDRILSIGFSSDGRTLASGSLDGTIKLWDVSNPNSTKEKLPALSPDNLVAVRSLAFSPNGKMLATASDDFTLRLWNVESNTQVQLLRSGRIVLRSIAFSPTGDLLAAGCGDGTIRLWQVQKDEPVIGEMVVYKGHTGAVNSVAFSPDGQWLVSGSDDGVVRLRNLRAPSNSTGEALLRRSGAIAYVTFSPDGKTIASAGADQAIRLLDPETKSELAILRGHTNRVNAIAYSLDGKTLSSVGSDGTIRLWEINSGRGSPNIKGEIALAVSHDGRRLVSDGIVKGLCVSEIESGKLLKCQNGHTSDVWSLAFSPDDRLIVSGGREITIWNAKTFEPLKTLDPGQVNVNALAFSRDGLILASGQGDGSIALWDIRDPLNPREIPIEGPRPQHRGSVNSLAFSPDGKILASGSDDQLIKLWDVESRRELLVLSGHSGAVTSLAFSPDGKTLASGSKDSTIKRWDLPSRQYSDTLKGHLSGINTIAYSPDGKVIVSGSEDGTINVWDTYYGQFMARLNGPSGAINALVFSPVGRTLISSDSDRVVRMWVGATDEEVTRNASIVKLVVP